MHGDLAYIFDRGDDSCQLMMPDRTVRLVDGGDDRCLLLEESEMFDGLYLPGIESFSITGMVHLNDAIVE